MLASCNKDEHQHSYTGSVTTPATCSNPGVETFTCSCGLTYTQIIPATGDHSWEKVKEYPASCESEGWTVYECSVCHEQKQDDWVQKRDHKYEAVETVEATCTTDGYQIMQCSYCGDRYTDDQYSSEHKATGHKWIVNESPADPADLTDAEGWKVVKAADCLNAAQLQRTCSVCGDTEEKVGAAATGHKIKDDQGKLVDPTQLCKVNDKLVDAEGNKIYAFECVNENCPVSVVVDARGTKKHYVEAVEHELKTVYEHINCEDTDDDKSYILQICENCDTYGEAYVEGTNSPNKKTEVEAAGHDYNTVQTDGKTSVVVCIEDKGLNTQAKYLEYMRSVVDFATFQANKTAYANYWTDVADENPGATGQVSDTDTTKTLAISRVCARCGAVTVANGHNYVIAKYVDGSFTEYEKDEDGALVDYSKEVTVASMNCRYVRICSGCGDVTNRGTHKNVSEVSCRAPGVCADCGRDAVAQKAHIYANISTFVGADGKVKDKDDTFTGSTIKHSAAYDAWKKVSATETWMVPVNGDCDSASTDVTVCVQCVIDAAAGKEVVWNQATEKPEKLPTTANSTNAYVITSDFSHDYQPVYFDLDAKDTTAEPIPAYNTDCQIGFKTAYICSKCGEVFTNVPVANDPDTVDPETEKETDKTNEALANKFSDGLPQVFTDANGFVIDSTKVSNKVDFQEEELAEALAAVLNNKGQHILYLVKDYAGTTGYEAPTCATVAKVPYYCLNCGQIIVLDATATGKDNDDDVNAAENTYNIANKIVEDKTFTGEGNTNSYGYTQAQVTALEAAVLAKLGDDAEELVSITKPEALDETNHAGKAYGCGTHCDYKVNNAFACTGYNSLLETGNTDKNELTDTAIQTQIAAMKHDTVTVEYRLASTVSKYYSNYAVKIANVGEQSKNPAATEADINNYITSFEDYTYVSVCSGNTYKAPSRDLFYKGEFGKDGFEVYAGKYLVLVDENDKAYQFVDSSKLLTFYNQSDIGTDYVVDIDATGDNAVKVLDDDIFFVSFSVSGTLPVAAPVTASDTTSLGLAMKQDATVVTENGKQISVLNVSITDDITLKETKDVADDIESIDGMFKVAGVTKADRYVIDLGGNTLTQETGVQFAPKGKDIVFKNGELAFSDASMPNDKSVFNPTGSGKFTLDGVTMTTAAATAILVEYGYEGEDGNEVPVIPEIVINNSTINAGGAYAVSTNASIKATEGAPVTGDETQISVVATDPEVKITITNSTLTAGVTYNVVTGYAPISGVEGTALFINVPSDVTVEGSTLAANRQVVMVRGGELEMSDSTVTLVKDDTVTGDLNMVWDDGNEAPHAAMLLGNMNRASQNPEKAYQYKTTVILDNVTFNVDASDRTVVIASEYEQSTIVDQDDTEFKAGATENYANITTMPVMVYFDGGNCVNDKQVDFVDGYIPGTIQLIDCGNASGIY